MPDEVNIPAETPVVQASVTEADFSKMPWLQPRLEQKERATRMAMLAELGTSDINFAKAELEEFRKLKESQKSESERTSARIRELEVESAKAKELADEVNQYKARDADRATRKLAALSESQITAVKAIAGDDPTKILTAINALRPTWQKTEETAPAPKIAPVVVQSNTSPGKTAPNGSTTSPIDRKAEYKALKESGNPVVAAAYLRQHEKSIYPR